MAQISTMENGGTLIDYPAAQESIDMEKYYETKYESCPWQSAETCKSCRIVDCKRRINAEEN